MPPQSSNLETWEDIHKDFRQFKRFVSKNKRPRRNQKRYDIRKARKAKERERESLLKERADEPDGEN